MVALSLSEISALAIKAARGVGYSWGVAQEAGFATKWLSAHGRPGASALATLLQTLDGSQPTTRAPAFDGVRATATSPSTCSLALGCLISDLPNLVYGNGALEFPNVIAPLLLTPFLSRLTSSETSILLNYNDASIEIYPNALIVNASQALPDVPFDVSIQLMPGKERAKDASPFAAALFVDPLVLNTLETFAARTYVPESDLSRARGAGGAD